MAAACSGAIAGLIAVVASLGGAVPLRGGWSAIALVLAVLLALDSLVAFLGPRRVFYSTAVLSAALAAFEAGGATEGAVALVAVVALCALAVALCLLAAKREGRMPEQSNPMNLPVFG